MRLFIDTSSLFKRYADEPGTETLIKLITEASEIIVSPLTWIEMNASIERYWRHYRLPPEKANLLRVEIKKDFLALSVVTWNENLTDKAINLVRSFALKSMDVIQLASGLLSESDIFVTSDHQLHLAAKKVIKRVQFI